MIRLFVGLQLPADVRAYLTLLRLGIRGARWQRDDQLHLTLQFIGPVDGATAQDIDTALVAVDMPRFSLAVSGGRQGASGARQFLESFDGAASRVFEVDRFVLFSSHPGNDGSIYRVEADYLLR